MRNRMKCVKGKGKGASVAPVWLDFGANLVIRQGFFELVEAGDKDFLFLLFFNGGGGVVAAPLGTCAYLLNHKI